MENLNFCRITACWLALVGGAFFSMTAAAQKEDVVIFNNGDHLTGEIRGLGRGQLAFNTDATGTIQIDWVDVAELRSRLTFEIELTNGQRLLGSLLAPEEAGELIIDTGAAATVDLPLGRIVGMTEIEAVFRDRIDLDLDFGYDFTKSSDVEIVTMAIDAAYTAEQNLAEVRFNTIRTDRGENGGLIDQASLNLNYTRLLRERWLATGLVGFESNSELGIDLRTTVGGAAGRLFRQSGEHRISWRVGLIRSKEEIVDSETVTNSTEGLLNLTFDIYRATGNEFDISSRLTVFPSFSQSGRYRSEFDLDLEWELYQDITWGLSFYHNFDSDPPLGGDLSSGGPIRADYGIISSVGIDF